MKNSQLQRPSPKETSSSKGQTRLRSSRASFGSLNFGVFLLLGACCLVFLSCPTARAQSYAVDWFTIDGGGGASSGGNYTLSGTIGQHDAGTLSGGNYTLQGGFWPGLAVPSTTSAPTLFIQLSGGNLIISWAPASTGFSLEQSSTLLPSSWGAAPSAGTNPATIPVTSAPTFYRLRKP